MTIAEIMSVSAVCAIIAGGLTDANLPGVAFAFGTIALVLLATAMLKYLNSGGEE